MNPKLFKSTKRFTGFPCTHRQWRAESHCRFVHGYSREFYFEFEAKELTKEGWVVDFGGLKELKEWLDKTFDHTFLASQDDPFLETFREMDKTGIIQLRVLPNPGMEGTALYVYEEASKILKKLYGDRAWISLIEVSENDKNSSIYTPEKKMTTRFSTELPVRPDDIDQFNHVHNSRYLDYIQAARYQQMIHDYKMGMKEFLDRGHGFVVKKATLEFKRALKMDDMMIVHTQVREIGETDILVDVEIINKSKNRTVLTAEMLYTMIKLETGWSEKIPEDVREKFLV